MWCVHHFVKLTKLFDVAMSFPMLVKCHNIGILTNDNTLNVGRKVTLYGIIKHSFHDNDNIKEIRFILIVCHHVVSSFSTRTDENI